MHNIKLFFIKLQSSFFFLTMKVVIEKFLEENIRNQFLRIKEQKFEN
tara:strand:- start:179 stop:319 length:141 start_codon:yes stop_codon:yes gene_type:complete